MTALFQSFFLHSLVEVLATKRLNFTQTTLARPLRSDLMIRPDDDDDSGARSELDLHHARLLRLLDLVRLRPSLEARGYAVWWVSIAVKCPRSVQASRSR